MKVTQVLHSWQRITADWEGAHSFRSLTTLHKNGFSESNIFISGGLLILAGVNSGGKSRILRSISSAHLGAGDHGAVLSWEDDEPEEILYVDLFELLNRQWQSHRAADLTEQVEAAGLSPFGPEETRTISYILGRKYDQVRIAELDATGDAEIDQGSPDSSFRNEVVPYFEVSINGVTHSSPNLSRGELSALTLHWVLQSSPKAAVLLLDEPDLMLSPLSAKRALDVVVDRANKNKAPVIVATHSYLSLAEAPRSSQALIRVGTDGKSSLATPDDFALWDALRVAAPTKIVFVVEDMMARTLLREFLAMTEYQHVDISDIWLGGSSAEVRAVGKLPQLKEYKISMWGVLDGNETISPKEKHCLKLPGMWAPEEGAIQVCESHPNLVTDNLPKLSKALELTVGDDPHDRIHRVAEQIGRSGQQLVVDSWRAWLKQNDEGVEALALFAASLHSVQPPGGN